MLVLSMYNNRTIGCNKKERRKFMSNEMKNEILAAIGKVDKKVDNMQEEIKEMKKQVAKIPGIEKQVAKIPEIEKQIVDLQIETRNISRSVAVIEHEHGDKLKALFDAFAVHTEKMEKQENRICFCEHKLENHENEIYYLKNKVRGL